MKKVVSTGIIILFLAACSSAQSNEKKGKHSTTPTVVQDAFKQKYPNISTVKWEKEEANYEASFRKNKIETSVVISEKGKILETESEISNAELPKLALTYIETNFSGQKIKEAAKIELSNGIIQYEAEVKGKDLIFDEKGNFIKSITN